MATIVVNSGGNDDALFTCLSCSIAFTSAEEQRVHYRSDHHRYNMKRRVASLPPVTAAIFNEKVAERRETAVASSVKGSTCEVCNKSYTTENAYRTHMNSKKHKESASRAADTVNAVDSSPAQILPSATSGPSSSRDGTEPISLSHSAVGLTLDSEASQDAVNETIDAKIAAAASRLSPMHCLFCPSESTSVDDNIVHMAAAHSFFIPDVEYLTDFDGLLTYLGEKVAVGNVCLYCNGKGREFRTMDAVRKHMLDKSHCKIAYESEADRLEISDYYDFTSSYPDNGGWEDVEDDNVGEVDEVIEESGDDSSLDDLPGSRVTYGDSHLELVLPSGARIGHRSLKRYFAQSLRSVHAGKPDDPNSGAALVRRLLSDKNSTMVPRKGGFGAFGDGYSVVKAKNAGEAREAGRHVREFRDQKRREDFKTRVGYRHNHQKHFRDPLLQ